MSENVAKVIQESINNNDVNYKTKLGELSGDEAKKLLAGMVEMYKTVTNKLKQNVKILEEENLDLKNKIVELELFAILNSTSEEYSSNTADALTSYVHAG